MVIASNAGLRQCVIIVAAMLAGMGSAAAEACAPAAREPEIRISAPEPRPVYRHALTRPQIGALGGHGHMTSDRRHAGLTQTQTGFTIEPTLEFHRVPGGVCATLKKVDAVWKMPLLQVDVAVDYARDSCAYAEILQHENQHVAIAQRAFAEAEHTLRADLRNLARRFKPFLVQGTSQQAAKQVAAQLMAGAGPALERYKRDVDRQNAAIDTPENYRAVTARCRNW